MREHHSVIADSLQFPCQAPLFMEFSRQEYWGGLPFPSPGDLPKLQIEPGSPVLLSETQLLEETAKTNASFSICFIYNGLYMSIPISQFIPLTL